MSDKTPDSTGSEPENDGLRDGFGDQLGADPVDEAVGPAAVTGPASASRRRTTSAPVRRKGSVDPVADDEAIAELEGGFSEDEQRLASRRSANAPVKKTTATRKRSASQKVERDPYTADNPATFVKQSASEIKKVVWPTWSELQVLFFAVLIFVLFIIAFVGGLDMLFGWGLLAILGDSA